jgi:hypothetical protein
MPPSAFAASAKRREALEDRAETKVARVARSWVAPAVEDAGLAAPPARAIDDTAGLEGGSSARLWLVSRITVSASPLPPDVSPGAAPPGVAFSRKDALPKSDSVSVRASERADSENGTAWGFPAS